MSGGKIVEGIFAINKPPSITSAQVLREVQRVFNTSRVFAPWLAAQEANRARELQNMPAHQKRRQRKKHSRPMEIKIGHGGTLDPMATGVLIVGVGAGTKGLGGFLECTKSYETTVLFGATSDTYDVTGKLLGRAPTEHLSREKLEMALDKFRGKITQRPPMYSALRVQGKRLYEYAREGKELPVDIKEREVRVDELSLLQWLEPSEHELHWPVEEAGAEEKVVAAELLATAADEARDAKIEENASLKRKREDEEGSTEQNGTESKAVKVDTEAAEEEMKDPVPPPAEEENTAITAPAPTSQPEATLATSNPAKPRKNNSRNRIQYSPRPNDLGVKADAPAAKVSMTVSSGFYVRSLCHDLGKAVDSLGLMAALVRTRQAEYELGKNVLEYDDFSKGEDVWGPKLTSALEEWMAKKDQGAS